MFYLLLYLSVSNEVTIQEGMSTLQISESITTINFAKPLKITEICILNPTIFKNEYNRILDSNYENIQSLKVKSISGTKTLYILYVTMSRTNGVSFVVLDEPNKRYMIDHSKMTRGVVGYDLIAVSYANCNFEFFGSNIKDYNGAIEAAAIFYEADQTFKQANQAKDEYSRSIYNSRYLWVSSGTTYGDTEHRSHFGLYFERFSNNGMTIPEGYKPGVFNSNEYGRAIFGEYTGFKYNQISVNSIGERKQVTLKSPGVYFNNQREHRIYVVYISNPQGLKYEDKDVTNFVYIKFGKEFSYDSPTRTVTILSFRADQCYYLSILYNAGGYSYWSKTDNAARTSCLISYNDDPHTVTVETDNGNVYTTQRWNSVINTENKYYPKQPYTTQSAIDVNILWDQEDPKRRKVGFVSVNSPKITRETPKLFSVKEILPMVETGSCIGCTMSQLQVDGTYTQNTDKVYLDIKDSSSVFISNTKSFVHFNWSHPQKVIRELGTLYLESVDGRPHPITIMSNTNSIYQNPIEKLFMFNSERKNLIFDEEVTVKFEVYKPDLSSYSNIEVYVNGAYKSINQETSTFTNVKSFKMSYSNHLVTIYATPNNKNSFYSLLEQGLCGSTVGNEYADSNNNFNSRLGFNSLYIPPGQQVSIIRPEAQKLFFLALNKEEFFDQNGQKIDSQIENLDHDLVIKSSDHVRVLEFAMIDISDAQQYIIIYNSVPKTINLDHRVFDYSLTKLVLFYILGPDDNQYIRISSYNSYRLGQFENCAYRLRKLVFNPSEYDLVDYFSIYRGNPDKLTYIQQRLRDNNLIDEIVITNIQKDLYSKVSKKTIYLARSNTLDLYDSSDTDILICSNNEIVPIVIYNNDKFIDENGNRLLSTYANKKLITISKNSPIFREDSSSHQITIICYVKLTDVDYIEFLYLSGSNIYTLNKELEEGKKYEIVPIFSSTRGFYGYKPIRDYLSHLEPDRYRTKTVDSNHKCYFFSSTKEEEENSNVPKFDFASMDQSMSANIFESSEYISYDGFLDVPSSGTATITFKFGYVVFSNAENFVFEDSEKLETHYKIDETKTFKIIRNSTRIYDHNQLHYFFFPLWDFNYPTFIINYYSEVNNDVISIKSYFRTNDYLIIVNTFNCSIKFNYQMTIYETTRGNTRVGDSIDNVRCVVVKPTRELYRSFQMVVNQYYQNPAIEEYPFKKIDYENKFYAQASETSSEVTYHEVEYPKHGQFFIRLTRTKREFDIEAGTSVSIYCDDFDGIVAVAKFTNHEKNLLRFGIMNVAFKENGKLILSYEGVFNSKVAFVNFYEMYQNDCQQAIVYGSSSVTFTNTEVTEPGHIQVMSGKCQTLYIFFFYKGTKVRIDETAMFNVEYNFLYGEDTRYVRSNENEFDKPLMIKIDSEAVKDKDITINIENPHAVEKSYLITENSTYKSAISEDLDKYVITLDGENISETEKPEPEPDPEKPDPEKPDPEKPDPEKPEPEKPDPEKSEPENPQPEIPNNEKPETPKDDKQNTNGANKKNTAGIVAGVLVALIVIAAVCIIGFIIYKRRQSKGESEDIQSDENKSEENMDV